MLNQFRSRYPTGGLISDLVKIDREKYIVRTLIQNDGVTLATGLAAANTIEQAEDRSRARALEALSLSSVTDATAVAKTETLGNPPHPPLELPTSKVSHNGSSDQHSGDYLPTSQPQPSQDKAYEPDLSPAEESSEDKRQNVNLAPELPESSIAEQNSRRDRQPPLPSEPPFSQQPAELDTPADEATRGFSLEEPDLPLAEASPASSAHQWMTTDADANQSNLSVMSGPIDFSDIIAKTNVEMKRLGWTSEQGRKYLLETYGKRSRQLLSDEELLDFLNYLESL
ncbi:MAG: hypothetical protein ACFB4I_10285 [Cyanophyceae cyanobacterium]